ncbi:helix-turn-helix domain-containing protein [Nostoc sp. CENA67]|uniref:Helix-turn-helix domain-containing protein n=1 Tax=Amazonocrinis nigriterrae CENA67 TaxID=2794033 RepID=A0A8J7HTB8_9NOST|nr:helix-turn-helix domain-containing protein [Amazonocrinis nigriterrae]MBH8562119.1 helix-turn-helix domain-containing protein [Amazonocrinis nigriterrae CENA67]
MSKHFSKPKEFEKYDVTYSKYLTSFQRKVLLKHLQDDLQPEYRRRLEIMLLADTGKSQTQICQILGCSQEMARYWIAVAQAGMAHTWNERPIGRPKTVNAEYIERLQKLVSHHPHEYGYPFRCWTAQWLSKHLAKEFGIEISVRHMYRLLKQLGLSTKQKHSSSKKSTKDKDRGITICDLQSNSEVSFDWSFDLNLTK